MSFARLVSEADETRALMEQFRKMREAQAQPPLPATATPLPPAPPAPPPPSPTPPPDITGEEKGATPVNRPTELEVAEQHEFLFPWEAAQEVWARSLSEPPSRSWSLRS
jgi:hypothetical protein